MINMFQPVFDEQDVQYVSDAIMSQWMNESKRTKALEMGLRETITSDDSYNVNVICNGTMGLFSALRCVGVTRGDKVLVPDHTAIGVVNAVKLCGAYPMIHDVDPVYGNMVFTDLPKVDAVLAVHNNGVDCNIDTLREHYPDTPIVEDMSQAFGGVYQGTKDNIGTKGDIAVGSLSTTKIITMGQGAFIVTNTEKDYMNVKALKDQGRVDNSDNYIHEGYNFKVTEMQSALGLSQLTKFSKRCRHMRRLLGYYQKGLGMPKIYKGYLPWRIMYDGKVPVNDVFRYREAFKPLHLQSNIQPFLTNTPKFSGAWEYSRRYTCLPCSSNLTKVQVEKICEVILE